MQEQIKQRLATLRAEHEAGTTRLNDLDNERIELQQTLLRIGGAIQILEELVDEQWRNDDSWTSDDPDDAAAT